MNIDSYLVEVLAVRLAKKLSFLIIYLIIPLPFLGYLAGGLYNFLAFYILFAGVPLIDSLVRDSSNPDATQEKQLLGDPYFKLITFIYVPIQIIALIAALYIVSTHSLAWYEWLGFCMSIGLVTGGMGINLAHEFMHKNTFLEQLLSKSLLSMVCYGHFIIEHVRGHHLRVATPDDPASAKLGESLYQFLPRTIIGSFRSALHLETKRLGQKQYALYSYHNQFWWIILVPILISAACYLIGGLPTLCFFLLQSIVAILILELVNYIEHYGLERQKLANGQYERVSPCHSWNANHWLSNQLLFHLQRHSDHHTHGARPYQVLRHQEESPQLPSGYLGMMCLALFPPLWRAVMDKRAMNYKNQFFSKNPRPIQIEESLT